ncbi:enoyl-CoA hydratase-related protein [Nocardioides sp. LHD-245]|uniref:enoyl-CoA hydratase/isomerase family protein n=1 Tax=Nocardioides sp. LHD-245 TaxID=3051387 RepID=UPI0027E095EA|nr:enoyl-CoA hydratase-related protein [Nocardioides sp. LHD-245]
MTQQWVTVERDTRDTSIAIVTLNRPGAANSIDLEVAHQLLDATLAIATDGSVRAVLLRGRGRLFCAGGDVRSFDGEPELARRLRAITAPLHAAVSALRRMDPPVVAAVHGPAAGAGLGLVCAADLVVAARSASFVAAYADIGLSPDAGVSWFLPRLVGPRRAALLTLTGYRLDAQEAAHWGLVTQVVPDEEAESAALDLARRLAGGPTRALGRTRRLLGDSFDSSLDEQLEHEARALADSGGSVDAVEGIRAFVDKRRPVFHGR